MAVDKNTEYIENKLPKGTKLQNRPNKCQANSHNIEWTNEAAFLWDVKFEYDVNCMQSDCWLDLTTYRSIRESFLSFSDRTQAWQTMLYPFTRKYFELVSTSSHNLFNLTTKIPKVNNNIIITIGYQQCKQQFESATSWIIEVKWKLLF